jgi:acyl-CoA thioesterase
MVAYSTLPAESNLSLHCLQTHFLAPGDKMKPLMYKIDRVKTAPLSALRLIRVEQEGNVIMMSTASFTKVNTQSKRPAITHSVAPQVQVRAPQGSDGIDLDDLEGTEAGATGLSSERLPVHRPQGRRSRLCQNSGVLDNEG